MQLDLLTHSLQEAFKKPVELYRSNLSVLAGRLQDMNPLNVLRRGYSMVTSAGGGVLSDFQEVSVGEQVHVRMNGGTLYCTVDDKEEQHE